MIMTIQTKLLIFIGIILLFSFIGLELINYQRTKQDVEANLLEQAETVRNILMATRHVYHKQFINSEVLLTEKTLGFLPAYALSKISEDFSNWDHSGLSFNNVSDQPRNMKHVAKAVELEAMEYFREYPQKKMLFKPFTHTNSEPFYLYARPIWVDKYCLKCHGKREEAPETIQKLYDTAWNYQVGDLRGILSIKLPASTIAEKAWNSFKQAIIIHLIVFIAIFIVIILLVRRNIIYPLNQIIYSIQKFAQGDYTQRIVEFKGEFFLMSQEFNNMAKQIFEQQAKLLILNSQLKKQVLERTAEIEKRKQVEEELLRYHEHLECKVQERTQSLKKQTLELGKSKEEADAANCAKSEFLANMSHEIRTPMNAVIGFSDILASKITDKKQKSYLNSIQTAGKSLLTLINDILDLSKIEAGRLEIQYEPVNPQLIFTELQQIFSLKMAEKNLELMMEIDETLPQALLLDETRLRQVLLNLMGNAVKFTDSGYITLCAKKIYTKDDHSEVNLILAVKDSGIGIPANQQALIFESFRQQDGQSTRQYGGTGLGLAITKRLVEMMNGHITVESHPGKGSCFEITLHGVKVAVTLPTVMQDNTFDSNNITFEKTQVLVVDDIESNRDLIKEYLSPVNLDIISASNGQEALLFAEEYHPTLILMDIRMPEMNGYEATKHLKDNPNTADIPVIALTASVALNEKSKIEAYGFDGFLSKPVNISDLLSELSRYLKYTKKAVADAPQVATTAVDSTLNPAEIVNLSALRNQLKQEVMPLWKKTSIGIKLAVVAELAERMITLGKEYNVPAFIHYGEPLQESTQTFNLAYIQKALQGFPVFVKPLMGDEE